MKLISLLGISRFFKVLMNIFIATFGTEYRTLNVSETIITMEINL